MEKELKRNIRLGVFVIIGFVLLVWGLYSIGRKSHLFSSTIIISSVVHDVSGLQPGNNVRFLGIDVGTVEEVDFLNDTSVLVVMRIREDAVKFIRKDALVTVGTEGLMGNKIVDLIPGSSQNAPVIEENDKLASEKSLDTDDMLRTLNVTNTNVADISKELSEIVKDVKAGRGTLGLLISDSLMAQNLRTSIQYLKQVSQQAANVSTDLKIVSKNLQKKGTAISAMSDTSIHSKLNQTIASFENTGKSAQQSAKELEEILEKVKSGHGTVGMLLNDKEVADNLEKTIENARKSTYNFNQNMEAIKNSFLFRGYFKRKAEEEKKE